MPNDKPSSAPMLAFLLAVVAVIVAVWLVGGRGLASWMANGGLGKLLLFALLIGAFFGALYLLRRR
jgi:uncharacterized sodium:solute symporter family permease YidK